MNCNQTRKIALLYENWHLEENVVVQEHNCKYERSINGELTHNLTPSTQPPRFSVHLIVSDTVSAVCGEYSAGLEMCSPCDFLNISFLQVI